MNIPQAARELAEAISQIYREFYAGELSKHEAPAAALITAALKRCRNEALEEAAIVAENTSETSISDENDPQMTWDVTADNSADAIRNLKEAE